MMALAQKIPYPQFQITGTILFSIRNCCGGPRLPNTSMVIIIPVLQQGHLCKSVLTFASGIFTYKPLCNACSFPRFQVLLNIP